ncbi:imelysin family protein [Owenweeksia hongkongensis]|uniref:imelysin family protein n=1 Tax=Owenweeksia hongkongensis TaxID=253245 RepID=UPI003A92AAF7
MNIRFTKSMLALAGSAMLFAACSKDDENTDNADPNAALKQSVVSNYADIVFASYEDAHAKAVILKNKLDAFVDAPSQTAFDEAKQAWLDAREPYGQTEVYRFYSGPIDDNDGPEGALNAWPLDEAHVDYVQAGTGNDDNPGNEANIINNTTDYPTIDEATLIGLNENGGEKNISIGYHAIEFLLWGQDFNAGAPGDRPYTDYVTDGSGTATNQDRRGDYLKVTAKILVDDLATMVEAWKEESSNYRGTFTSQAANVSIKNMLTGMGVLSKSELAGERIYVALDNQDQEDEHSCFSDNTHRDIILNAQGIENVYTGTYTRTDGTVVSGASIYELLKEVDATLAEELNTMIATSVSDAENIPVPFDQALTQETVGGNGPIMTTVHSLQDQGDKIAEAAAALGISISTDLPD